jgi:predicted glycogen debranching enzyme
LEESRDWYFDFEYAAEKERGLDGREDLFNPIILHFALQGGSTATVIASTEARAAAEAPLLRQRELERRTSLVDRALSDDPLVRQLSASADQYIVQRGDLTSVIAGYHWFADWGRDTMIALPGLSLMTGRPEIAREILETFVESADQGMLPNRFPEAGELAEYNTVDAALWLFEAVRSYLQYTDDFGFVRDRLYSELKDIVDWHLRGTRFGIHMDSDGLLACGEPGVQLTWMDAKIGDWVVTPRTGKPVEIQALWYNALCILHKLAQEFDDSGPELFLRELSNQVRESFGAQFWNADTGCLYDVINGSQCDAAIRPNQIFAVSLHHRMLVPEKELAVVEIVQRDLYTPLGLRSLSPKGSGYRSRYEGGVWERDSAYHQGTVWPWLIGPFISAYVKAHGRSEQARKQAEAWLLPFRNHVLVAGLGHISEIADGDAPHEPRGCVAQAWSVAELLRAAIEDVYEVAPSYRAEATAAMAAQLR